MSSSFRNYGGVNNTTSNYATQSHISNAHQMNITQYSGQLNTVEVFYSHIDLTGNSLLHTGCIYFQDGTTLDSAKDVVQLTQQILVLQQQILVLQQQVAALTE